MPVGIAVSVELKYRADFSRALRCLLRSSFSGYFLPQCGYLRNGGDASPASPDSAWRASYAGAFQALEQEGIATSRTFQEFFHGEFRRLPDERPDSTRLLTTLETADCTEAVLKWAKNCEMERWCQISVFGSMRLRLSGVGDAWAFRQLVWPPIVRAPKYFALGNATYQGIALLRIVASVYSESNIGIVIDSDSDVWLERGRAFRGTARAMAAENTETLAGRIRDFVVELGEAVDDVQWWMPDPPHAKEKDRLWRALRVIPGIYEA